MTKRDWWPSYYAHERHRGNLWVLPVPLWVAMALAFFWITVSLLLCNVAHAGWLPPRPCVPDVSKATPTPGQLVWPRHCVPAE